MMMSSFSPPRPSDNNNEGDHIDGLFQNVVAANASSNKNQSVEHMSKLPSSGQTEKLLAQEMNGLSIKEREKIYENIHGVTENIDENPDFVAQYMELMERALQKIREKNTFNMAMVQSPTYVHSLYLRFLRSTGFDPKKAASKLVLFLEVKLELFGIELLVKRIGYDDLNSEAQQCVNGWHQVLPFRDRAGRTVIWLNYEARKKDASSLSNARALYYISTLIVDDEETQKRGVVAVDLGDENEEMTPDTQDFLWKMARYVASMPLRIEGHHICLKSKLMLPVAHFCVAALGREARLRTRIHQGTYTETSYILMTFGIPVDFAPITSGGKVKLKYFRQWLTRQFRVESIRQTSRIPTDTKSGCYNQDDPRFGIELPFRNDILVGTGVAVQSYSGNVQFLVLAAKYHEQYTKTVSGEKKKIVEHLYDVLHSKEYSARFLMRSSADDWWKVAPREVALKKIAHRLRAKQPCKLVSQELSATNQNSNNDGDGDAMNVGTTFLNNPRVGVDGNCCLPDNNMNPANKRIRNL